MTRDIKRINTVNPEKNEMSINDVIENSNCSIYGMFAAGASLLFCIGIVIYALATMC